MKSITHKIIEWSCERPISVYLVLVALTVVFGLQIPQIKIDTDPENMLDATHPSRVTHNQVKKTFAMHDAIVVGLVDESNPSGIYTTENLTAIYNITASILTIEGVVAADLMSVSTVDNLTQDEQGNLRFEWMMDKPPVSIEESQTIRQHLERLPLLRDTLVSQNGQAVAIYVPIVDKNQSFTIAKKIRAEIDQLDNQKQWYITGLPVAEDQFGFEMFIQMGISAPLAGVTIFFLLFLFFRNLPLIIAPMIVAMATVIVTMGALIGLGFTVHIMSSMIAIFLMPIAVVDSVHILSEFSDRFKPGQDLKATITQVVEHLFTPMLYTSVTSSIGFYSLMLTPIPPVQIFGAFVGSGILLAFLITITFIPAYLGRMSDTSLLKLQQALHYEQGGRIARLAKWLGKISTSWRRSVLLVAVSVFLISIWGVTQIQINDNPVRWFKQNHEIRVADKVLNSHFAGTYDAYLVLSDKRPLPTAEALLPGGLPSSLETWVTETLIGFQSLEPVASYQELLIAADDKLFDQLSDSEIVFIESWIEQVEQQLSHAKSFQEPDRLLYISGLQAYLESTGLVGKSNSLADVTKVVNRELRSGDAKDYQIPISADAVAQTLLQYQSSHRPNDLWHFVTPDYRQSLVWLQLTSGDNQDMTKVIRLVENYIKERPLPDGFTIDWAGKAYLNVVWQENMVAGMLESLLSAFVIVFIMMTLLFRSLIFGVLAMLPLTLTITFIYGLIGIIGKDYDMPIAVLSALTLGLSVDFAIHFLERARSVFREKKDLTETFKIMFDEPATAISRNALVIALGFTPLLFAPLVPYITVGVFLASIMAISALVTLLLLPSVITTFKRWVFAA